MTGAIVIRECGGPDQMVWEEVVVGSPKGGEVRIRHTAIGLNFIDVYHRTGLYPVTKPFTPGLEAAGVIESIGEGVTSFKVGDRVAYNTGPMGAYSESRLMPADKIWKLPDSIGDETAAAMILKGGTVEYLVCRTYPVKAGDWVLFHAAAGGVGLIAIQWLKSIGANVIGTVGSLEKAKLAKSFGLDHAILYQDENFVARVQDITNGQGVDVVYDSIGKDTFIGSLDCLKPLGMMVSFGNATGPVDPFEPSLLNQKGSIFLTRPKLMDYYAGSVAFRKGCDTVGEMLISGKIQVNIGQKFTLKDAPEAHRKLESRGTTGSTILIP
ncbi:MAG: quinone oxidoreductase family protein [Sphingomonadales bacterium]